MPSKYGALLGDVDVRRWHENLAAKSILTATVYLRALGFYCELNGTNPRQILDLARSDGKAFRDSFTDFVRHLEREGKAGSYIVRFKKVLRSWLLYNGVDVKLRVNIAGEGETPTIAEERVPSREELAKILRKASPRGRVAASLIAFSGLRPESLGDYEGKDGLRLKDFPDAQVKPDIVVFPKAPAMLIVRRNLSKSRHHYFTFAPREALTYIREHLEERVKRGERLEPDSPVLGFDPRGVRRNPFIRTTLVSRDLREAIVKAGFRWRPYVLRAYASTAFDLGESKGLISHPWRLFVMGRRGDVEARYSTNKRLPPDMVEEMRSAYARCEELLVTTLPGREEDPEIAAVRAMVESGVLDLSKPNVRQYLVEKLGIEDMAVRVAKMKESGVPEDEAVVKVICGELGIEPLKLEAFRKSEANGDPKKVICEHELERYLAEGWDVQTLLPSGKILIRK